MEEWTVIYSEAATVGLPAITTIQDAKPKQTTQPTDLRK